MQLDFVVDGIVVLDFVDVFEVHADSEGIDEIQTFLDEDEKFDDKEMLII